MIKRLLKKDIQRLSKQPVGFLILVSLPLLLTALMGIAFGPGNDNTAMPSVQLAVVDQDSSMVSGLMLGAFGRPPLSDMFDLHHYDEETARERLAKNKVSAAFIIPNGFQQAVLDSVPTQLRLIKNPSQQFGPKIAEEAVLILGEGLDRLLRLAAEPMRMLREQMNTSSTAEDAAVAAIAVAINQRIKKATPLLMPPAIELKQRDAETGKNDQAIDTGRFFSYILAGIAVMFLFFILNTIAGDLFTEREQRTLYRTMAAPVSTQTILFSKQIYVFLAGLISFGLMWIAGVLFMAAPISWSNLLPFSVLGLVIVAAATGVITFLHSLIKNRLMVGSVLPAVIIVIAVLGGGMIPLSSLPPFIRTLSPASPAFWGTDGIQKLLVAGEGLNGISTHIIVLAGVALLFGGLGIVIQKRRLQP